MGVRQGLTEETMASSRRGEHQEDLAAQLVPGWTPGDSGEIVSSVGDRLPVIADGTKLYLIPMPRSRWTQPCTSMTIMFRLSHPASPSRSWGGSEAGIVDKCPPRQ